MPRTVFITGSLSPVLGMEKVALSLVAKLAASRDILVVSLEGEAPCTTTDVRVTVLGPRLRGWARLRTFHRALRVRRLELSDTYVVVGVWAAIAWLSVCGPTRRSRTVVWEHSLLLEKRLTSPGLKRLARLAAGLYPKARAVVCVSECLADDVRALAPGANVLVIPNIVDGVAALRMPARRSGHPVRMLAVGSLTETKRVDVAIKSLAFLPHDYTLNILGDGPSADYLRALANDLGVADRVQFAGYVSADRVNSAMREADVLVHPSAGETFGMVFYEAANVHLPVVATSHRLLSGIIPELVPGQVFDGTPLGLARTITAEWNPPLEAAWGRADRARKSFLNPDRVVQMWQRTLDLRQP